MFRAFGDGPQADLTQQPLRGPVQEQNKWIRSAVKPKQRIRNIQGGGQRPLNCQPSGLLVAGRDVQESRRRATVNTREQFSHFNRIDAKPSKNGAQQSGKYRLTNPTEGEAGEGNPKLGGTEESVQ